MKDDDDDDDDVLESGADEGLNKKSILEKERFKERLPKVGKCNEAYMRGGTSTK